MVNKISELSKALEGLSSSLAQITEKIIKIDQKVLTLDSDRLDQWKIIKDLCDKVNNDNA